MTHWAKAPTGADKGSPSVTVSPAHAPVGPHNRNSQQAPVTQAYPRMDEMGCFRKALPFKAPHTRDGQLDTRVQAAEVFFPLTHFILK